VEEVASHAETSALRQEPAYNVEITRRSGPEGKRPCVLVDAQQEQCGLYEGDAEPCLSYLLYQECGCGSRLSASIAGSGVEVGRRRMVVNGVSIDVIAQALQGRKALGVDQYGSLNGLRGQVLGLTEGQLIPVERQEPAEIAVGTTREHCHRVRVQFGSS